MDIASLGRETGKWYWEIEVNNGIKAPLIGISNTDKTKGIVYFGFSGNVYNKSSIPSAYGKTYSSGDIISVAIDIDKSIITFYKNGESQGIINANLSEVGSTIFPAIQHGSSSSNSTFTANFGAQEFKYPIPEGYSSYDGTIMAPTDPTTPVDPTPQPSGDRAILTVTMTTGLEKEFDLSMSEITNFINWYDAKENGSGPARYGIDKHSNNKGPFTKRVDYVIFKNILSFEVDEYNN